MALEPDFLITAGRGKGRGKKAAGRGGGAAAAAAPEKERAEPRIRATVDGVYKGESIVGAVVGAKGSLITEMQRVSGAHIHVDADKSVIVIDGTADEARPCGGLRRPRAPAALALAALEGAPARC